MKYLVIIFITINVTVITIIAIALTVVPKGESAIITVKVNPSYTKQKEVEVSVKKPPIVLPHIRYGIALNMRKHIYCALLEDLGKNPFKMAGLNPSKRIGKRADITRKRSKQYVRNAYLIFADEYGISEDVLHKVYFEGMSKRWPKK